LDDAVWGALIGLVIARAQFVAIGKTLSQSATVARQKTREPMDMDDIHQGSCLCGAVKYRVSTELKAVTHCHCRQCQKTHGAAFATYASAPKSALSVIANAASLKGYESSLGVTRQFCSNCGSSLFWSDSKGIFSEWVSIAICTLDTPLMVNKQKHSFIESKACWYAIKNLTLGTALLADDSTSDTNDQ
jgi:hypothetical protein